MPFIDGQYLTAAQLEARFAQYQPIGTMSALIISLLAATDAATARAVLSAGGILSGQTLLSALVMSGTANAQIATTNGMATLSSSPQLILVTPTLSNSSSITIVFDANAAVSIISPLLNPLNSNEWAAGVPYLLSVTSTAARILMSGATW